MVESFNFIISFSTIQCFATLDVKQNFNISSQWMSTSISMHFSIMMQFPLQLSVFGVAWSHSIASVHFGCSVTKLFINDYLIELTLTLSIFGLCILIWYVYFSGKFIMPKKNILKFILRYEIWALLECPWVCFYERKESQPQLSRRDKKSFDSRRFHISSEVT
jgi:hypothetical protein